MQLALLGSGDRISRIATSGLESQCGPNSGYIGYDEALAHLIQAGADALVVPSRFEPCGLTQLCALRYGTVPIVSQVGGLADTVIDADEADIAGGATTGFEFGPGTDETLAGALRRASNSFHDKQTLAKIAARWHVDRCIVARSREPICCLISRCHRDTRELAYFLASICSDRGLTPFRGDRRHERRPGVDISNLSLG